MKWILCCKTCEGSLLLGLSYQGFSYENKRIKENSYTNKYFKFQKLSWHINIPVYGSSGFTYRPSREESC